MKVVLLVSYDGTDFCGWQRQKKHRHASPLPNIQETIELALSALLNEEISLSGSGRTDAGVHAINQVCHFETSKKIPKDLCWALKAKLPPTIVAKKAWLAPDEFHSTISATKKTYRYWIWNHSRGSALLNRYSWWIRLPLELNHLNAISSTILGKHDFESFRSEGTPVKHSIRTVEKAIWVRKKSGLLEFSITGSGFMKQMVRNIVGTHLDICFAKVSDAEAAAKMKKILAAKDRTQAGRAAPPQGLFLEKVYYPTRLAGQLKPQ